MFQSKTVHSYSSTFLRTFHALLVAVAILAMPMAAQATESDAARFIQDFTDDAIARLTDTERSAMQKEADFRELLTRGFYLDGIGRFVLGQTWRRMDDQQRADYLAAFENYIVATYSRRIDAYSGEGLIVAGAKKRRKDFVVESHLKSEHVDMRIDWRVRRMDGDWKIVDVSIEGISMIVTQRSEFAAVLRGSGGDVGPLVAQLRRKWTDFQEAKTETVAAN